MKNRITLTVALLLAAAAGAGAQDMPLSTILVKNDGWKEAAKDLKQINWLGSDETGRVILRDADGWAVLSPVGELTKKGHEGIAGVDSVQPTVHTKTGFTYAIAVGNVVLQKSPRAFDKLSVPEKLSVPSGLVAWPDGGTLVVGDAKGNHLWAFKVEKDGKLSAGERYYPLRTKPDEIESHVTALAMDNENRLYACTPLGVQVFDPTGRLCGVVSKPGDGDLTGVALGGKDGDTLYVACGDKVYSRKVQVKPKPK